MHAHMSIGIRHFAEEFSVIEIIEGVRVSRGGSNTGNAKQDQHCKVQGTGVQCHAQTVHLLRVRKQKIIVTVTSMI